MILAEDPSVTKDWYEPIVERWKPKEGEFYWLVLMDGAPHESVYTQYNGTYNFGNCFKTREQAEEAARRMKECLMNLHKEYETGDTSAE